MKVHGSFDLEVKQWEPASRRCQSCQQGIDQLDHAVLGQTDGDPAVVVQDAGHAKHQGIQDPIGKTERNGRGPSSLIVHIQRAPQRSAGSSGLVNQHPMPFYCCGSNGKVGCPLVDSRAHDTGGYRQHAMAFADSAGKGI